MISAWKFFYQRLNFMKIWLIVHMNFLHFLFKIGSCRVLQFFKYFHDITNYFSEFYTSNFFRKNIKCLGQVSIFEMTNAERPEFWNFGISNIKITKVEIFDLFIAKLVFLFLCLFKLFEHPKNIYINLPNWNLSEFKLF